MAVTKKRSFERLGGEALGRRSSKGGTAGSGVALSGAVCVAGANGGSGHNPPGPAAPHPPCWVLSALAGSWLGIEAILPARGLVQQEIERQSLSTQSERAAKLGHCQQDMSSCCAACCPCHGPLSLDALRLSLMQICSGWENGCPRAGPRGPPARWWMPQRVSTDPLARLKKEGIPRTAVREKLDQDPSRDWKIRCSEGWRLPVHPSQCEAVTHQPSRAGRGRPQRRS